jgi:hypothetical protein
VLPLAATAGPRSTATAVLRVYDGYGLSRATVDAAKVRLDRVFATTGIAITWTDCSDDTAGTGRCGAPVAPNELVVRFLHTPTTSAPTFGMGDALVADGTTAGATVGVLITVYADRVMRAAGTDEAGGPLLGLVIAHEIGHQLLGPHAHARRGLMRPVWARTGIAHDDNPFDWRFSSREIRRMHETVGARATRPPL